MSLVYLFIKGFIEIGEGLKSPGSTFRDSLPRHRVDLLHRGRGYAFYIEFFKVAVYLQTNREENVRAEKALTAERIGGILMDVVEHRHGIDRFELPSMVSKDLSIDEVDKLIH